MNRNRVLLSHPVSHPDIFLGTSYRSYLVKLTNDGNFFSFVLKTCDPIETVEDCDRLLRECSVGTLLNWYQVESWEEMDRVDYSSEEVQSCVLSFLETEEVVTLSQILGELNKSLGIDKQNVLFYAIAALNSLMDERLIREYDHPSEDYAWCLSKN